jgi:hypothetical protein
LYSSTSIGNFFSAPIGGYFYVAYGSYTPSIIFAASIMLFASIFTFFMDNKTHQETLKSFIIVNVIDDTQKNEKNENKLEEAASESCHYADENDVNHSIVKKNGLKSTSKSVKFENSNDSNEIKNSNSNNLKNSNSFDTENNSNNSSYNNNSNFEIKSSSDEFNVQIENIYNENNSNKI